MKINDVHFILDGNRVKLSTVNKRGQVSSQGKDITKEFLEAVIPMLKTNPKWFFLFKDKMDKHYKVDVTEITEEEAKDMTVKDKARSKRSSQKLRLQLAVMGGMLGHKPMLYNLDK